MLLAAYLKDQGLPGALRIYGEKGGSDRELESHVWLKYQCWLIDITGSQFEGYNQPDILVSERSTFLETFKVKGKLEIADFRERPEALRQRRHFLEAYDALKERLSCR
ncbi:hypothetical protein PS3A_03450 [Pseudomonas sp. 3A(2025)]